MIFLDTNVVIHFNKRSSPQLVKRVTSASDDGQILVLPVIAFLELEVGARGSAWPEIARSRLEKFLAIVVEIIPFEQADALVAADLRAELERKGQVIGAYDLLIAAQVLRRGALLVSNSTREFSRVPDLLLEDWLQN